MSMEMAEAMAYSARAAEALELAERLDKGQDENLRLASFSFLLAALRRGVHLREAEQRRLIETMEIRIKRREDDGNASGAAGEAVGLGNYYIASRNFEAAVQAYEKALGLDPGYESREHFWLELAGAYFHAGQFPASADAYQRALALAEPPALEVEACRADALMHAGQYEDAYRLFEPITADETHLGAWAATKAAALHWVISTTGIASQDRDPEGAARLAGQFAERTLTEEEVEAVSTEIWHLDAVSPLGWFNLARDYLDHDLSESGMYAYLVTAVMQEGDVEAWANVAALAINLDEASLTAASIVTGAKLNGERYMVELARQARANLLDEQTREEFLSSVNALLEEALPEKPETGFEVRFVNKGEPVESVHLPPPGRRA
jgi:tetratricopeptide (TPR) repeat protein